MATICCSLDRSRLFTGPSRCMWGEANNNNGGHPVPHLFHLTFGSSYQQERNTAHFFSQSDLEPIKRYQQLLRPNQSFPFYYGPPTKGGPKNGMVQSNLMGLFYNGNKSKYWIGPSVETRL